MATLDGPLAGVRVLEFAAFIAGPFCGQMLSDLGADVVKIERPNVGDPFRGLTESFEGSEVPSSTFEAFNRGKRSVELDLRSQGGQVEAKRLARDADVIVENFRPGVMEELSLGYRDVESINARAIYCSISGFGQVGPYADRPAYDAIGVAMSGLGSQLLEVDDPRLVGPNLSDCMTAMTATQAIMAALYQRTQDGTGQHLDVSMIAATTAFLMSDWARYFADQGTSGPRSRPARSQCFAVRCADGAPLVVHLSSSERFWRSLLEVMNRPELAEDPRFAKRGDRVQNYEVLQSVLNAEFERRTRDVWCELLSNADVPHSPVYALDEVLRDPHVATMGLDIVLHGTDGRDVRSIGAPARFNGSALTLTRPAPLLGEHTAELLEGGWDGP